tara:strand:- start:15 stop:1364 length:1350 start_codon:yes stop_codon:yes gene_type:complete
MKFETIGNATLIIYEKKKPLIATDIWFDEDDAYFGSWRLSHKIPKVQKEAIINTPYVFISHFHPDHLNLKSLRKLKNSTILLGNHYNSRVEKDLRNCGFNVISLPPRKWISIGTQTKIMLFCNHLQDTALLAECTDNSGCKSLILNLNDSAGIGFRNEISSIAKKYKNTFYLSLHGYGDADMINLFQMNGQRIPPKAALKLPTGKDIQKSMRFFNSNIAIPFSSHHQYQRRDSFWANKYTTPINAYKDGFIENSEEKLLDSFQSIILVNGSYVASDLNPEPLIIDNPVHENKFGDDWEDKLTHKNIKECIEYFNNVENLKKNFNKISINIGGEKHIVLEGKKRKANLLFRTPKSSLMKSIRNLTFDDLLIGNYMETYIQNMESLYSPDFSLSVAKYSDNGGVRTSEDLKRYFAYYAQNRSINDQTVFVRNKYLNILPGDLKKILKSLRN